MHALRLRNFGNKGPLLQHRVSAIKCIYCFPFSHNTRKSTHDFHVISLLHTIYSWVGRFSTDVAGTHATWQRIKRGIWLFEHVHRVHKPVLGRHKLEPMNQYGRKMSRIGMCSIDFYAISFARMWMELLGRCVCVSIVRASIVHNRSIPADVLIKLAIFHPPSTMLHKQPLPPLQNTYNMIHTMDASQRALFGRKTPPLLEFLPRLLTLPAWQHTNLSSLWIEANSSKRLRKMQPKMKIVLKQPTDNAWKYVWAM